MLWQRNGTPGCALGPFAPSNLEPVSLEAKLPVLTFACKWPSLRNGRFTRNGHCVDQDDDAGSHHVSACVLYDWRQFLLRHRPDKCGSQMQCDGSAGACPVEHWCVCQWAFASSYLERAGGCDRIQKVVCEATNMVALKHCREQAAHSCALPTPFSVSRRSAVSSRRGRDPVGCGTGTCLCSIFRTVEWSLSPAERRDVRGDAAASPHRLVSSCRVVCRLSGVSADGWAAARAEEAGWVAGQFHSGLVRFLVLAGR